MPSTATWLDLETVTVSQTEKDKTLLHLYVESKKWYK